MSLSEGGLAGQIITSPLAFAVLIVALYWAAKVLKPASASRPPLAPYWIPWVGSAIEMGKDPDRFIKSMTKALGPVFRVKTLGQEMVLVTTPSHISAVYRDSQTYNFTNIRIEMGESIFAIRKALHEDPYMVETYMPGLHRLLLPNNLKPMVSQYLTSAHDLLLSMITSMNGASGPLKSFIIPPAYRAACEAGFGTKFPSAKSYPFFKDFDDNFHLLGAGLPKFLFSKPIKAWHNLIDLIEAYVVEQDRSGQELPTFCHEAMDGRNRSTWTYRDVATVLAAQLWALQANAIFTAYWLIAIVLQQPAGLTPLADELDEARRDWQAAHTSTPVGLAFFDEIASNSKSLPLLSSAIQEALRFSSSPFSIRRVVAPVTLAGYQLQVGERVVCATRLVHLDDEIHAHADQFDMRRYLKTPRAMKDGKMVPNHTMPFGGGVSMCEGRHFAMSELKLFLAILLTYATIEIDEGCTTRPKFMAERVGTGIIHPRGDMDVILRKRKL
ncbi:cytochrome P450 [Daedaleopsis nitida]|nr:cytochrome P450 [Daedaleopsis nitida]